jgi:16S rRNA (guanine527-N7)-methyltransferase
VSARAVASLREILALSAPLFGPETVGLFPKGRGVDAEIVEAEEQWRFQHRLWPSRTDREAMIVEIRGPEQRPRT